MFHLLLGGMISPLPSHSPHTALLCCTIPGPICDQSKRIILLVKNSERIILNKTFTIFDPPHLDCLDLDPPALAACARLHVGAALPPAVVAHAVPRGCQLSRLEKENIRSLSLGYTILQSCFVKKSNLSIIKLLQGDSQLVNHRLCLVWVSAAFETNIIWLMMQLDNCKRIILLEFR